MAGYVAIVGFLWSAGDWVVGNLRGGDQTPRPAQSSGSIGGPQSDTKKVTEAPSARPGDSPVREAPPNLPEAPPPAIRETSSLELIEYLDSLPPLQRGTVVKSEYLGRRVSWTGWVFDVDEVEDDLVVTVLDWKDRGMPTFVRFDSSWRGRLEPLRRGDGVRFEGTLRDVLGGISVDGTAIERIPPKAEAKSSSGRDTH